MNTKKSFVIIIVITAVVVSGCLDDSTDHESTTSRDYRQDMRDFVKGISVYAKGINPDFIIIPQNGHELLTDNGEPDGLQATEYINAIDGAGQEDLFYGYYDDNVATPQSERSYLIALMDIAESNSVEVLVTDYCWDHDRMDDSYEQNAAQGYISFAAPHRELDNLPSYPNTPYNVNAGGIDSLAEARNFLYLVNPGAYHTKTAFLEAIGSTDYDIVLIDAFYLDTTLRAGDVTALKTKANGGNRLVIAYMSIGEAENYRYYWQTEWETNRPSWLAEENPYWPGNYRVRYWDAAWQNIIYGNNDAYLKKILDVGFDGVYLDIIDAFDYFEEQ